MPQMMVETFVSQLFWFTFFFFFLNFYFTNTVIPAIARTMKIRRKAAVTEDSDSLTPAPIDLTVNLPSSTVEKTVATSFNPARQNWLSKNS